MANRVTELPDDRDEIPDIDVPLDREAIVSMFEENLEHCGTEYAMDLIENSGEMEWLEEKAERRMLEICAERLRKFNTSERVVEWFRDYHGLNDEESEGSE